MTTTTDARAHFAARQHHSTAPIALTYNPSAPRMGSGIYCLNDLRDRCRIDSETGCWHWGASMAMSNNGRGQVPRVAIPSGVFGPGRLKTVSGCRAAWLMSGKILQSGWVVWRTCMHNDCINPAHLKAGTKAEEGAWMAEHAGRKGDPKRAAANRINVGVQAIPAVTVRQIEALLSDGVLHADIQTRTGVHKATISKIANRKHYHQRTAGLVRGASVFAMGVTA